MTDGLIWVGGSTFDSNSAVGGGGGILLDPSCANQARNLVAEHTRLTEDGSGALLLVREPQTDRFPSMTSFMPFLSCTRWSNCPPTKFQPVQPLQSSMFKYVWLRWSRHRQCLPRLTRRVALSVQGGKPCLLAELDASTFVNNHAGAAGGAVGSTSAVLPVELRCAWAPTETYYLDLRRLGAALPVRFS